jgi:Icc-related predicted phosphoesterase
VLRLLVASDFHGSETTWRKLLNAVKLDIWKVDAILVAGDLAGKGLAPIVRVDGGWQATIRGQTRIARTEDELAKMERQIADMGIYGEQMSAAEVETLEDPGVLAEHFNRAIYRRLESWMRLAEERLEPKGVPMYVIPGNDDPGVVDAAIATSSYVQNVDRKIGLLPDGREIIGLAHANPTPWATPRELPDDELGTTAESLVKQLEKPRQAVIMFHCPPYGISIDEAPKLDDQLRPVMTATGGLMSIPVGSQGIRDVISRFQPALGAHGHIHESGGHASLGKTVCVNAGSEYTAGVLRAYIVHLDKDRVIPLRAEA